MVGGRRAAARRELARQRVGVRRVRCSRVARQRGRRRARPAEEVLELRGQEPLRGARHGGEVRERRRRRGRARRRRRHIGRWRLGRGARSAQGGAARWGFASLCLRTTRANPRRRAGARRRPPSPVREGARPPDVAHGRLPVARAAAAHAADPGGRTATSAPNG